MKKHKIPYIITALTLLFLYVPMVIMAVNSFNNSAYGNEWQGFTLDWYRQLFTMGDVWHSLKNTLIIGISASITSTTLGTLAAFALYRYDSWLQKIHYGLTYLPLVMPEILMGISLLLVFVFMQISLSLWTVFIAHTTFCVSYVTFIILSRLRNFDYSMVEASLDLGASPWVTLRRVVIPQLMPGLLSGALLAFTISIDDYIITAFVAGPGSATLPIYIYGLIKFGLTPVVNALSTLLLLATFISVLLVQTFTKDIDV